MARDGYYTVAYKNSGELEDGREVTVRWRTVYLDRTFDHPAESEDGEPEVYIDGQEIDADECEAEVDDLVKTLMEDGYTKDTSWPNID